MGEKFAVTVRFRAEGMEAELYRKIQEGMEKDGLSATGYVKRILSEYFADVEKQNEIEKVLLEIREEYQDMIQRIEQAIHCSIQEHSAVLMGALNRMGMAVTSVDNCHTGQENAELPEEGVDIPEGALEFLDHLG